MKPGDYELEGNKKKIKGRSGKEYYVGPKFNKGGVGKIFKAKPVTGSEKLVFKEYSINSNNKSILENLKENILHLIDDPVQDDDGSVLKSVVLPLDFVDLPASGSFGYIMKKVDLDNYLTLRKLWNSNKYPDAKILCQICKNIVHFFNRLHIGKGLCYKDLNEGNIFFNPKTGDVKIIDNDNIGVPQNFTIKGTTGYMAPEVLMGAKPDRKSDLFSMAVFLYRLLVGGYPLEGKQTLEYLKKHEDQFDEDFATNKMLYGEKALFVFDPKNHANSIRSLKEKPYPYQTMAYDNLPAEIKDCFVNTFSTNLSKERSAMRTDDKKWYKVFDKLEQGLQKCPKCHKWVFGGSHICPCCGTIINLVPKVAPKISVKPKPGSRQQALRKKVYEKSGKSTAAAVPAELTMAVFSVHRTEEPSRLKLTVRRKEPVMGKQIYSQLADEPIIKLVYSAKRNKLALKNLGEKTWTCILSDKSRKSVKTGEIIELQDGLVVTIIKHELQLTLRETK